MHKAMPTPFIQILHQHTCSRFAFDISVLTITFVLQFAMVSTRYDKVYLNTGILELGARTQQQHNVKGRLSQRWRYNGNPIGHVNVNPIPSSSASCANRSSTHFIHSPCGMHVGKNRGETVEYMK